MISDKFKNIGEYGGAGMYEEPHRSLFYRKALGIRRFYENCELGVYNGEFLYPSGVVATKMDIYPSYMPGMHIRYDAVFKKGRDLFFRILHVLLIRTRGTLSCGKYVHTLYAEL